MWAGWDGLDLGCSDGWMAGGVEENVIERGGGGGPGGGAPQ